MDKNKGDYLLVIRLSAMGDVSMTVPVLLSLVNNNPSLKLLVLTRPFFAPIFKDIPNTEVFPIDLKGRHKGIIGIYRLSKDLRKYSLAGVADLHNVLRTILLKAFFFGSSIDYVQQDKGRKEKKSLTRWAEKDIRPLKSTHERYADVFRKMGYTLELTPENVLKKRPLGKDLGEFKEEDKKLIGIAPFAAFQGKMYPLRLMEHVLQALQNTDKYKIILFGGGTHERDLLSGLESKYTNCSSAAGRLSFEQELDLISNLDLMVSMDSGNGHLAAMFGVPVITLWGITHPSAGFAPFGQSSDHHLLADRTRFPMIPTSVYGNTYPKGYEKAIETIDPKTVFQKIEEVLKD